MKAASSTDWLAGEFARRLQEYHSGQGEYALTGAYEIGRRAAAEGVSLLDLTEAYWAASRTVDGKGVDGRLLVESLTPYEMKLRAFHEHARTLGLGERGPVQSHEIDRARVQLRTILDATTAVITLKDAEGAYLYVNQMFEQLFGLRRDDVVGRMDRELLPPAVAQALQANDRAVLSAATPLEVEEVVALPDRERTYLSLKVPLLDGQGPYAVCSVSTDITERKRSDLELRRAKAAAEMANQELESFSYSVAHDLRAPLRSINGFTRAVLEDYGETMEEGARQYLSRVVESAHHMADLIEHLLALSRVTRVELRRTQVDLSAMAQKALDRIQSAEPGRQVALQVQPGLVALGDPGLLSVALDNLLTNAWKFTQQTPQARIEFGGERRDGGQVYFVRDNGAGFDPAYADKLFGVFQRLHSADEFEGTGVGLATVRRVVSRHGGRVWAEGAVGQGATFYFTLAEE